MEKKSFEALTEPMFYVLMSFLAQERCGTEIAAFVETRTGGRVVLGPGTLYTILAKFEADGLIKETAVLGRKRTYVLTGRGEERYRAEVERLRGCLRDAAESEREALEGPTEASAAWA